MESLVSLFRYLHREFINFFSIFYNKTLGKLFISFFWELQNILKFLNGRHSCQVHASVNYYSSVIRRKGESQNGYFKKIAKFSEKRTFLTPWYAHVRIRGKKCLLFGKFGVFCLLETPVLRFAFSLNTDVLLLWVY